MCVPTFGRPQLVQRAIRSIVESLSDPEVAAQVEIIVSDNSPAVSEEACRQALAGWGGRSVYLANRPDIGVTANFNQCIMQSSGRHVLFVHDDDHLLPGAVPAILDALHAREVPDPVLMFGIHIADESGRILRRQEFCGERWVDAKAALHRLLSDNGLAWFPGMVVSREAYEAVGLFEDEFGNVIDLDMWVRLFARYGVRCVPAPVGVYSVHADSATQSMSFDPGAVARLVAVFDRARKSAVLSSETVDRCQADYLHQVIIGAAAVYLRAGNRAAARSVIALFNLPSARTLGPSPVWRPIRLVFRMLVRCPSVVVRPLMRWVDRFELVRRVRAVQNHRHTGLPLC